MADPWRILRWVFFKFDPETAHRMAMKSLSLWSRVCPIRLPEADVSRLPKLRKQLFGLTFPNPLGLAAGFDKDAEAIPAWQALGFGFIEVGTVTSNPQPGNPRPRLFRLPKDEALLNRMGFNNRGAREVARRIEKLRRQNRIRVPLGINIGKSKLVPIQNGVVDYLQSFSVVSDLADYVVINVSSPNTEGLRELQEEKRLKELLDALGNANEKRETPRPLLLKISPDLDEEGIVSIAQVAVQRKLAGMVVSNTTVNMEGLRGPVPNGGGGLSGRPLFDLSTEILRFLHKKLAGRMALIGVGGVMDVESARAKLEAGADLIQTYTGFVYGGPKFPRKILRGIADSWRVTTSPT